MIREPMFKIRLETKDFLFYILNPGDRFPGFGKSRYTLVVKKTASIIVRTINYETSTSNDVEYAIDDPVVWDWIGDMFNRSVGNAPVEVSGEASMIA